ncbi:charged multivesicular body protein 7 [Episyrphus balteatus]|uniref:charged multivesicular body protein 7 n=1 Tax=Episyrphus balteatus TaxID=286459 RepID=UPI0024857D45|nr:charged multivesicular body protein 7 [Episyrphus balteatus]
MVDTKDKKLLYPPCWSDDTRMDVLMAPFRLKSVNPENYVSKMLFWQEMITKYCEFKGSPSFNKRELQVAFQRKNKTPYGLDNVLEEMRNLRKIRTRTEYMYDPENSWTGWAINSFVKKPLWWGVKKVWTAGDDDDALLDYIQLEIVKKMCADLAIVLQKHSGKLLHYDEVKAIISDAMNLNDDGLHICLHTLFCQKKVVLEFVVENNERKIHLVKIPGKTDQNPEITETDRAFHNLQMTQKNLTVQLESLETDIKATDDKARQYLKENKRQLAKTYLRKKHLLEKNYEKRSIALNNVETLLSSVDEAQNNGVILETYKIGSKALQKVLNDSGLKYDNVDEIISDVKEAVDSHDEIQDTIASAHLNEKFDDGDLERELREILGEPEQKTAAAAEVVTGGNNNIQNIEVTDEELLAMLEGLEVEHDSPTKSSSDPNANETV